MRWGKPDPRRVLVVAGNYAQYESYMDYADWSQWMRKPEYVSEPRTLWGLRGDRNVIHVVTGPGWQGFKQREVLVVARERGIEVKYVDLDKLTGGGAGESKTAPLTGDAEAEPLEFWIQEQLEARGLAHKAEDYEAKTEAALAKKIREEDKARLYCERYMMSALLTGDTVLTPELMTQLEQIPDAIINPVLFTRAEYSEHLRKNPIHPDQFRELRMNVPPPEDE